MTMRSHVLVVREGDSVRYVAYGNKPDLTTNLDHARRYTRLASAQIALRKLRYINPQELKIEAIDE